MNSVIVVKCQNNIQKDVNCQECESTTGVMNGIAITINGKKTFVFHPINCKVIGEHVYLNDPYGNRAQLYLKKILTFNTVNKFLAFLNSCSNNASNNDIVNKSISVNLYDNTEHTYVINDSFINSTKTYDLQLITNVPTGISVSIESYENGIIRIHVLNNSSLPYTGIVEFNIIQS